MSTKRLQYEITSYTTLQNYYALQLNNTTGTIPREQKTMATPTPIEHRDFNYCSPQITCQGPAIEKS